MKIILSLVILFTYNIYAQVDSTRLVDIKKLDPSFMIQMKYFTDDNFVGAIIDGYKANKCLLLEKAAKALVRAQKEAKKRGFSLLVHDCYRPQKGVNHFIRWSEDIKDTKTKERYYPNLPKSKLFDLGYIAKKSGHSRGSTVDLTLFNLEDNSPLQMGTIYDFLDPLSNTMNPKVPKKILMNREILVTIMKLAGFKNYSKEWWHYTLINEPNKDVYLDIDIE